MRKRRQLDKLQTLREVRCGQVKRELSEQQMKLAHEEQRLQQLRECRGHYSWKTSHRVDGLTLNSAHMMSQSVDRALLHQCQQVGVQQAQCNAAQNRYIHERMQLRMAEILCENHQKILNQKEARREQKQADEVSGRMYNYSDV